MKNRILILTMLLTAIVTGAWAQFTANSYFLTGTIAEWWLNSNYELTMVEEGLYKITDVELTTSDLLKVVKSNINGTTIANWYPDGMDNNQQVDEDGTYTIYFRPAGDGTEAEGYTYIPYEGDGSGLDSHGCTHGGYMLKFEKQVTVHDTEYETACDYFVWHGNTYTASGEYTYDDGTDIYKLNLTIHNSTSEIWDREVFIGQHFNEYPFDFDVTTETELTQIGYSTNASGCDNEITLNLTIVSLDKYYYDGELGFIYTPERTVFKLWDPTATSVKLNRYATGTDGEAGAQSYGSIEMDKLMDGSSWTGVWTCTLDGDIKGSYYAYSVDGEEIPDPWSQAVGFDGKRSMVFDEWDATASGWDSDIHTFYESGNKIEYIDVAAFSADPTCGVSEGHRGKYLALTETGTTYENAGEELTCMSKLQTEGCKAVIVTMTDPQTVPAPYSTNPYNGTTAINELQQAIMAVHQTFGMSFFVRFDFSTTPVNEVLRERYILETCQYWVNEFHADGIVLAADIDTETKALIRDLLDAYDTRIVLATDDEIAALQPAADVTEYIQVIASSEDNVIINNTNVSQITDVLTARGFLESGSVTFDPEAYKLVLNNAKISQQFAFTKRFNDKYVTSGMITIELIGDNEVSCGNAEFFAFGATRALGMTFTGTGTLKATGGNTEAGVGIISGEEDCSIVIDGPTIEAQGNNFGLVMSGEGNVNFEIKSGSLKATPSQPEDTHSFPVAICTEATGKTVTCNAGTPDVSGWQWVNVSSVFGIPNGKAMVLADSEGTPLKGSVNLTDEMTAGIGATLIDKSEMTNNRYYTLDGRCVEHPTKGVYIVNGKKVVIK